MTERLGGFGLHREAWLGMLVDEVVRAAAIVFVDEGFRGTWSTGFWMARASLRG